MKAREGGKGGHNFLEANELRKVALQNDKGVVCILENRTRKRVGEGVIKLATGGSLKD